jgi:hypothetical protein
MFSGALKIANQFTFPVVVSRKTVAGVCGTSIGTYVVVNDDGWIVTAGHILKQWHKLTEGVAQTKKTIAERKKIEGDASLSNKEKQKKLSTLVVGKNDHDECSAWWAHPGAQLKDFTYLDLEIPGFGDAIDIGIGRLDPFDPGWVKKYPTFKDPTKDFDPGRSLCKLGFPFHKIAPVWDVKSNQFLLPPGALPMPRFPIEGIFTRTAEVKIQGLPSPLPYPVKYVEVSTPGLKGQSGGPIIDVKGNVWAIQAKTSHLALGFDPAGPNGQKEHQFLNVGLGVHPETIFGLFKDNGIKYDISTD